MTGLLGTGPRAMPLRAAPGGSSGPRRVQRTKRNAQPVLQTPVACPMGAPTSSATYGPARTFAGKGPGTTGRAFRASLSLIPLLLRGHTGADDGGEDEPEPDGA